MISRRSRIWVLALLTLSSSWFQIGVQAKVYESLEEFASSSESAQSKFDFVVIGGSYVLHQVNFAHNVHNVGGTAGSVVASRLSEDLRNRVLLLEAGPK